MDPNTQLPNQPLPPPQPAQPPMPSYAPQSQPGAPQPPPQPQFSTPPPAPPVQPQPFQQSPPPPQTEPNFDPSKPPTEQLNQSNDNGNMSGNNASRTDATPASKLPAKGLSGPVPAILLGVVILIFLVAIALYAFVG